MTGSLRTFGRMAALAVAASIVLVGCIPIGGDPFAPSDEPTFSPPADQRRAAEQSRALLDYTIELPRGWNDLTDEYLESLPTSVLSGYWTMADDLSTEGPYVTVSMNALDPKADLTELTERSAQDWVDELGNPVRGDSGYAETNDGGIITWASVTGDFNDERRTEHVAHILYGPYYMYVEIDTPEGDEANAHSILDALKTVTISGPLQLGDRAGAPVAADGRWVSYCGTITADAQDGWEYQYSYGTDAHHWACPEDGDVLGEWLVHRDGDSMSVYVDRLADMTLKDLRELRTIPSAEGEELVSPNDFTMRLVRERTFDSPEGGPGLVVDEMTTPPDSDDGSASRLYAFEDAHGGVVEVYVFDESRSQFPETDWLEPFIASLATA